jgi:hypothetical protein
VVTLVADIRRCRRCGSWDTAADTSTCSLILGICCRCCGHVTIIDAADPEKVSDLANAIQAALLEAADLTTETAVHREEIRRLQGALRKAVIALRQLQRH